MTNLPPNSTALDRALEANEDAALDGLPLPLRDVWNPQTCPTLLLPWLAWGLSIDVWDTNWTEQVKRDAIANAIEAQRRKGTRATLREVLDRFDPLIEIVEWFEDRDVLDPHTFRLELPLATISDVEYDTALVTALLRDIGMVKPLRSHMLAVHRMRSQAYTGLLSAGNESGHVRLTTAADRESAGEPEWASYLQTENGEPIRMESGSEFVVAA